ncbi:RNA polymerase I-specific transcription initiation factor RRN3, partial [Trifolium medium]|nr:RNA polymerase I-specific transcription initiation factor RRN3 [Trifolium medium]
MYVKNMLRLESGAIGEIVGVKAKLGALTIILSVFVVDGNWMGWKDAGGCQMHIEDIAEFADDDEKYYSMAWSNIIYLNQENRFQKLSAALGADWPALGAIHMLDGAQLLPP